MAVAQAIVTLSYLSIVLGFIFYDNLQKVLEIKNIFTSASFGVFLVIYITVFAILMRRL
jgi:hypothetical protein